MKYIIDEGIIDLAYVREQMEMKERKEFLEKHPYKIWEGKDGKWYTYLPDKGGRKLVKRSSKNKITDYVIDYWKSQAENPTLEEMFKLYNDSRLKASQISKASHLRYMQDFIRFYEPWKDRKIKSITADELCDFMEERVAELGLTSKAFCNFKLVTKGIFKRAYRKKMVTFRVEEEVIDALDMSERGLNKVHKEDSREVYSERDFTRYVQYLSENPDIWNLALLLIMVTGLRGGEIVTLSYEDLEEKEEFFYINVNHTETRYLGDDGSYVYDIKDAPKTDAGIRAVIVPKQFKWIYDELLKYNKQSGGFIFTNPKTGKRLTTNSLRRRQERNCIKLNMCHKSPHKGRKTYGSILLDSKLDNNLILQQMGHVEISTTENHYHRNMKDIDKKAEIISDIKIFGAAIG